jgi:hypothetical protein
LIMKKEEEEKKKKRQKTKKKTKEIKKAKNTLGAHTLSGRPDRYG